MEKREIEQIAESVSRRDKKLLAPGLLLTVCLTLGGWVYSAGVLSTSVANNTADIKEQKSKVDRVPVIANEVKHNTRLIEENKKLLDDHTRKLEAIQYGQTEIKMLIQGLEK